jgi:hypothetical protein
LLDSFKSGELSGITLTTDSEGKLWRILKMEREMEMLYTMILPKISSRSAFIVIILSKDAAS